TVTGIDPAAGTPTGSVQFFRGGNPVGQPVTLSGGQATLLLHGYAPGSYPFSATYTSDVPLFQGSTTASNLTQSVTPAPLVITPAAGQSQVYGAAPPTLTYTPGGFVNGDSSAVLSGALGTAATAQSPVGTYTFTLGSLSAGGDYELQFAAGAPTLAVTPAPLSITPDAGQSKVYGAAVPALTYAPGGLVNGDTPAVVIGSLGTAATAASPVGSYAFTLGSLAAGANYTLALAAAAPTFAVTPAPLTVTPDAGQSKRYGAAVPALTFKPNGFVNGDTAALLTGAPGTAATAASPVGSYAFTRGTLSAGGNYALQLPAAPTFAVTPAPPTITADNQTMPQRGPLPPLTVHYSGLVNGDTPALLTTPPAITTAATAASAPGAYGITAAGAADPNYAITYVAGTLTVTAPPLSLTAPALVKAKGGVATFKGHGLVLSAADPHALVHLTVKTTLGKLQAHGGGVKVRGNHSKALT